MSSENQSSSNQTSGTSKSGFGAGIVVGAAVAMAVSAGLFMGHGDTPAPTARQQVPPPTGPQTPAAPFAPGPSEPSAPTPAPQGSREAADQLFNEVMMASEQGDSATIASVAPRAVAAYQALTDLDDDGRYHLAALELSNKNFAAARKEADAMLAREKSHLLALWVAAQAAAGSGDHTASTAYWQKLFDSYDTEAARPLTEYVDHRRVLPSLREKARVALGK